MTVKACFIAPFHQVVLAKALSDAGTITLKDKRMRILVGGGTGFIGSALSQALSKRGDEVLLLSRQAGPGRISWESLKAEGLPPCDAVVNLAGANVFAKRWTESYKREIFSSRIDTACLLARAIRQATTPPRAFVAASAIAYYPCDPQVDFDETGPVGNSFLSLLTAQWERSSELPANCPTARSLLRIGVALGKGGGAISRMLPPFRLGLGGAVGSGKQPFCWIHLRDLVALILFCIDQRLSGPFNAVAPQLVSATDFARTLGRVLHKPSWLRMPGWAVKLLLGERASLLLESPRVIPKRALEVGFHFQFPELKSALIDVIG
jgi:uncharacterized protein